MAPIPAFTVKDCTAPHTLAVSYGLSLNTTAEFVFDARITSAASSSPFLATSYFWEFGDGSSTTTTEPHAVHDYGKRPQEAVYSNLLVQVTALSADDHLVARRDEGQREAPRRVERCLVGQAVADGRELEQRDGPGVHQAGRRLSEGLRASTSRHGTDAHGSPA